MKSSYILRKEVFRHIFTFKAIYFVEFKGSKFCNLTCEPQNIILNSVLGIAFWLHA